MALTEDLDVFLRDMGVDVAFDGAEPNTLGLVDGPGLDILGDGGRAAVSAVDRRMLMRTDRLGTLGDGDTIVVDSVPYTVRDIQPFEDGVFSLVFLK